ncbi:hypothetical protein E4U22_001149 [Claviceps purpurea]|nr:hypothetical protein E4U22_001149 [Claviceps purpurea]
MSAKHGQLQTQFAFQRARCRNRVADPWSAGPSSSSKDEQSYASASASAQVQAMQTPPCKWQRQRRDIPVPSRVAAARIPCLTTTQALPQFFGTGESNIFGAYIQT